MSPRKGGGDCGRHRNIVNKSHGFVKRSPFVASFVDNDAAESDADLAATAAATSAVSYFNKMHYTVVHEK
jgi:hypothetical protein